MIVVPDTLSLAQLLALTTTPGAFFGAIVKLFQNDFTPSRAAVVGDFTEATYTGYAASSAVTWAAPFIDPVAGPTVMSNLVAFPAGSPFVISNQIYGYYVVDGSGNLLFSERFGTPVNVSLSTANIVIVPNFGLISQAAA